MSDQSGPDQIRDPLFKTKRVSQLTEREIAEVAYGGAGIVNVSNFIDTSTGNETVPRLSSRDFVGYTSDRYPVPASRIGPVLNEYRRGDALAEEYWDAVGSVERFIARRDIESIRHSCLRGLRKAWPQAVLPATVLGRPLYWGVIREVNNGTLLHWDELVREFPKGLLDTIPIIQLAFNVFLSVTREGGETSVWNQRWSPLHETARYAFGYNNSLAANWPTVAISKPQCGDIAVFDPRNYHRVSPGTEGRRVAVAFFAGICTDGTLILWS